MNQRKQTMEEMDFARAKGFARAIPSISSWKKNPTQPTEIRGGKCVVGWKKKN